MKSETILCSGGLCFSWPKIYKSIILQKQSWPYGALVEAKCWRSACCSWVDDISLHNGSWPQWDGHHWQEEAEAPGDARGSLVLLAVWALLALCLVIQNKKIKRETQGGGFQCSGDADTGAWGRAAWVSLEMQLSPLWFTLMTQGCFFFEDLWQYVWFMRRISLSSFFFRYQGLIGLADCHKGI